MALPGSHLRLTYIPLVDSVPAPSRSPSSGFNKNTNLDLVLATGAGSVLFYRSVGTRKKRAWPLPK